MLDITKNAFRVAIATQPRGAYAAETEYFINDTVTGTWDDNAALFVSRTNGNTGNALPVAPAQATDHWQLVNASIPGEKGDTGDTGDTGDNTIDASIGGEGQGAITGINVHGDGVIADVTEGVLDLEITGGGSGDASMGVINQSFGRTIPDVVADITASPEAIGLTGVVAEMAESFFYVTTDIDPRALVRPGFVVGTDDEAGKCGFVIEVDETGFTVFSQGANALVDEQEGTVEVYGGAYGIRDIDFTGSRVWLLTRWHDDVTGDIFDVDGACAWTGPMAGQTDDGWTFALGIGSGGGLAGTATVIDPQGVDGKDRYDVVDLLSAEGLLVLVPGTKVRSGVIVAKDPPDEIESILVNLPVSGQRVVIEATVCIESDRLTPTVQFATFVAAAHNDGGVVSVIGKEAAFQAGDMTLRADLDISGGNEIAVFITGDDSNDEGAGQTRWKVWTHTRAYDRFIVNE